jgi:hypothetical protein
MISSLQNCPHHITLDLVKSRSGFRPGLWQAEGKLELEIGPQISLDQEMIALGHGLL